MVKIRQLLLGGAGYLQLAPRKCYYNLIVRPISSIGQLATDLEASNRSRKTEHATETRDLLQLAPSNEGATLLNRRHNYPYLLELSSIRECAT